MAPFLLPMKAEVKWSPFSWEEMRTLHYLWKCQRNLVCEGLTWSMYGIFRLVVGQGTLDSLRMRGCITRSRKYDSALHDDYELTPLGQDWAEKNESAYLTQLEERFVREMGLSGGSLSHSSTSVRSVANSSTTVQSSVPKILKPMPRRGPVQSEDSQILSILRTQGIEAAEKARGSRGRSFGVRSREIRK
jgi:hypothetical protein